MKDKTAERSNTLVGWLVMLALIAGFIVLVTALEGGFSHPSTVTTQCDSTYTYCTTTVR